MMSALSTLSGHAAAIREFWITDMICLVCVVISCEGDRLKINHTFFFFLSARQIRLIAAMKQCGDKNLNPSTVMKWKINFWEIDLVLHNTTYLDLWIRPIFSLFSAAFFSSGLWRNCILIWSELTWLDLVLHPSSSSSLLCSFCLFFAAREATCQWQVLSVFSYKSLQCSSGQKERNDKSCVSTLYLWCCSLRCPYPWLSI